MSATLDHLLLPFQKTWEDPHIEEICINGPNNVWVWTKGRFERVDLQVSSDDITDIAYVAAAQWGRDVGREYPLLSCDLPGDGRLQAVLEPCVAQGNPSLTIRIGDEEWPTLADYAKSGFFQKIAHTNPKSDIKQKLAKLHREKQWPEFWRYAIETKQTIVGIGETASGKTRFSKALINEIPREERLITMEDAAELKKLPHPNRVQLYFDKEGRGVSAVQLVDAALRMRIGRLFFQELRDGTTVMAFMIALMTGHRGAITTLHAANADEAFDRLHVLTKQTPAGAGMDRPDVIKNLQNNLDIIAHFDRWGSEFWMDEVWYKPVALGEVQ